ncbi:hypothetical protein [Blastococcus xanthinilyticus]|uniref:Uncharacterized protein n=1 Tax=Blastococcus xanthinilyticus TaxID=1564164 RepID=A0A5S5D0X9_9ACTN|nr:hypothetical protein [Blastococcus xanthinilyticus]TYP88432.1 hypothetical protein BD833_104136 [Blastococcus xanthinilyticus]
MICPLSPDRSLLTEPGAHLQRENLMHLHHHLLADSNGEPFGVMNLDIVRRRAARLSYALAVASNDPAELDRLACELIGEVGVHELSYIAIAALQRIATDVVQPLIVLAEAEGIPVREQLTRAASEGGQQ